MAESVIVQDGAVPKMESRKAELEQEVRAIDAKVMDEHGNTRGYTPEEMARVREIRAEQRNLSESIVMRLENDRERSESEAREAQAALRKRAPTPELEGDDARRAARWRAYEESDRGKEFRAFLTSKTADSEFSIPRLMRAGDSRYRDIASVPTGQTDGNTNDASDWVAEIWSSVFEEARRRFNGLEIAGATMFTTPTGGEFHWPTVDDTEQEAVEVQENFDITNGVDPTFGEVTFNAIRAHTGLINVTRETLQDTIWSVEAYLMGAFGQRMGRLLAKRGHNGSGNRNTDAAPAGRGLILDARRITVSRGSPADGTGAGALGNAVGLDATDEVYDALVDLRQAIEPYYLPVSAYVVARDFETVLLKLKDGNNRPLYLQGENPANIEGAPAGRLLGYPVYVLDSMVGTDSNEAWKIDDTFAYFGDVSKYVYRMVAGLDVIRDPYSAKGRGVVQFLGQFRYDSRLVRAGGVGTSYARSPIAQLTLAA